MMKTYIVDTCVIRQLLFNFSKEVRALNVMWEKLEVMIKAGEVIFVKESYNELDLQTKDGTDQKTWIKRFKGFFYSPTNEECVFVAEIYSHRNFRNNVAKKNILEGRPVADAFIVAKARVLGKDAVVVTNEVFVPHAAKIPNMCDEYNIGYISHKDFQNILFG